MIKIEDLIEGETTLLDINGYDYNVIELFKTAVLLEDEEESSILYTPKELNKMNFTIKKPIVPEIPQEGDYYDTLPEVIAWDSSKEQAIEGRLIRVNSKINGYRFKVLDKNGVVHNYQYCHYKNLNP
jgi:hypothetical protein